MREGEAIRHRTPRTGGDTRGSSSAIHQTELSRGTWSMHPGAFQTPDVLIQGTSLALYFPDEGRIRIHVSTPRGNRGAD